MPDRSRALRGNDQGTAKRPMHSHASGVLSSLPYQSLLEQRLTRQAILLQDLAQALEALYLDLPHTLTGQTNLQTYILQGAALMTAQAEAANHHFTLLVREL